MIDKQLANQYGDVVSLCKALKPHATNLCFMGNNGETLLQPVMHGILNWAKLNTTEVDIGPFVHTYLNIGEATSVNAKFRKTKSEIEWIVEDRVRMLHVSNPDGTEMKQPIFNTKDNRNALYQNVYKRILEEPESYHYMPLDEVSDWEFEPLPMEICDLMVRKQQVEIIVGGHSVFISRPLLGDLKKTEWIGAKILSIRDRTENDPTRKARIYFKQREPLMDVYTYGAFLILEE